MLHVGNDYVLSAIAEDGSIPASVDLRPIFREICRRSQGRFARLNRSRPSVPRPPSTFIHHTRRIADIGGCLRWANCGHPVNNNVVRMSFVLLVSVFGYATRQARVYSCCPAKHNGVCWRSMGGSNE